MGGTAAQGVLLGERVEAVKRDILDGVEERSLNREVGSDLVPDFHFGASLSHETRVAYSESVEVKSGSLDGEVVGSFYILEVRAGSVEGVLESEEVRPLRKVKNCNFLLFRKERSCELVCPRELSISERERTGGLRTPTLI